MKRTGLLILVFTIVHLAFGQEKIDLEMMKKIREEGMQRSRVMNIAFHLTDVTGPRLTASPGYMKAANWAREELTRMGLSNANLEAWGEFGKGWDQRYSYVAMISPYYTPLIAVPRAWTGSTPGKGPVREEVVIIKAKDTVELMQYAGKIKGKIVMTPVNDQLKPSFEPDAVRHADSSLARLEASPGSIPQQNRGNRFEGDSAQRLAMLNRQALQRKMNEFYANEKPALVLSMNPRGTDGTIFVGSGGSYNKDAPLLPAMVMLSSDDYLRIQRLLEAGVKVELEADIKTNFYTDDLKGYNVIAEIPGTDPLLKDEIVMLGGHLDSWHGATGATDNASGCAVMMEAMRILKSLNVQPRRTIRIALWSGEEQGLHGSRNYVKNHFADPVKMELKPDHAKVSAYYNLDNGTGRIRGIYAQGNKLAAPIFKEWLEPFADLGAKTVTLNNTGSTDHVAFDAVGIPGFQFIQDWIEYNTRTHHTNMDTYDHLVPDDLKQASVIVAAFVYNTAQRDEKLPRKELPKAQPTRGF